MSMADSIPDRCFECPWIGYDTRLQYYPHYYCKMNSREIRYCSEYGWERMIWCPLGVRGAGDSIHDG